MKYSYMPVSNERKVIEFGQCWFDSDLRIITFYNQYNEQFTLAPNKTIICALGAIFIIGLLIGRFAL